MPVKLRDYRRIFYPKSKRVLCKRNVLWSSFFVTLAAKKYHE